MDALKDRVRKLRKEKGVNQDVVAEAIHVARGTYASYENGITPPMAVCIKLAEYFGVSVDYLVCVSSERRPAGGKIPVLLSDLAQRAGDAAPTGTDLATLLEAAARYYRRGAPCGNAPLSALVGFMDGLRASLDAATAGDGPALIDGANAAAVAALEVTKMPAAFYEQQKGDIPS